MSETLSFTTGDGCRIAYRFDGDERHPVLVLSNSIATTLQMWDDQIAALSRQFRVLRYDTRGHGKSDAPVGAYSIDRLGRDVIELLDGLDIASAHFCGLSLGGMIGQWLGIRAPERIRSLILSNTSAYLGPADYFDGQIATTRKSADMTAFGDMFLGNWFPRPFFQRQPRVIDKFRAQIVSTPAHGLAGNFAAVRDMDLRRTIALITNRTLVIGGRDDTVTLASHSEAIAATIPQAKLIILPGVHLLNVELPDEFLAAVVGFLSGR